MNCDRRLVFALSLHLASAHECVSLVDMDPCRIDGHPFFVLHHLIGAVRRCECRARNHGRHDAVHGRGQNFSLDDAHDRHLAVHELVDQGQNFSPDVPDDPNYHDAGDLGDHNDRQHLLGVEVDCPPQRALPVGQYSCHGLGRDDVKSQGFRWVLSLSPKDPIKTYATRPNSRSA